MFREYCKRVNMPFEEDMMEWDEGDKKHSEFVAWLPFFEDLLNTRCFQKEPSATRATFSDPSTLPDIVKDTIKSSMPYYEKLYSLRIQI